MSPGISSMIHIVLSFVYTVVQPKKNQKQTNKQINKQKKKKKTGPQDLQLKIMVSRNMQVTMQLLQN